MKIRKKSIGDAGITLVALVVTIIVLLILAGITINMVLGKNGLIQKSKIAKEKYEEAAEMEKLELAFAAYQIGNYNGEFNADDFKTKVEEQGLNASVTVNEDGKSVTVTLNDSNNSYTIDNKGNITPVDGVNPVDPTPTKPDSDDVTSKVLPSGSTLTVVTKNSETNETKKITELAVGDEVTLTKGDVTEPFHVISVDHTTKKLRIFAKYCLDKNPVSEGSTFYKQAPGAIYALVDHHFSNASYWDQKWSNQKDKWKDLNINHSENYENDIAIKMAVDYGSYFGGDGKLLTKDEATVMQNNSSMQDILWGVANGINESVPPFLNYWLATADNYSVSTIYDVNGSQKRIQDDDYQKEHLIGVRPVVDIEY